MRELADAGYADVEEVRTAEEDLIFSLPKELRDGPRGGQAGVGVTNDDRAATAVRRVRESRRGAAVRAAGSADA